ncbi:MAG: hypothetical protein OWQ51_03260 [Pyrobaculum arsenaticum]|uniref:Uncharacterized protein n=1 Tax=Pyrobaculum oguniense (strain DSM 13380 / JCM 10595 / TE7) TaxID=698757 RepID=H6QE13_PYROT|nr:hypothetical protein Pogu_ECE016 [Pyrobaculum oguniense TE7]MCY0889991.1 hypothetical protein [Pyrobaculum arsenaticum]
MNVKKHISAAMLTQLIGMLDAMIPEPPPHTPKTVESRIVAKLTTLISTMQTEESIMPLIEKLLMWTIQRIDNDDNLRQTVKDLLLKAATIIIEEYSKEEGEK